MLQPFILPPKTQKMGINAFSMGRAGLTIWWAPRTSQRGGPTGKRGAEGAEIETSKASGAGNGEEVSPSPGD